MKPVSFALKEAVREEEAPQRAAPRPGSWIARHWRGELTLTQSYWINMGLLSVPFTLLAQGFATSGDAVFADAPRVYSALTIVLLASCFVVGPWQIVGVWRSAARHIAATGQRFWARGAQAVSAASALALLLQLVAVAPLAWHLGHFALGHDTMPAADVRAVGPGREIQLTGTIGFGTAERLAAALRQHPRATVLRLTSPGGRIGEARRIAKLVAGRKMTTYAAGPCFSACTTIFLGGAERVMHEKANLGFHQPGLAGVASWFWRDTIESDARRMTAAGVDPDFVARATAVAHDDLWKPGRDELLAAHVATRVSDGSEFAIVVDDPRVALDEIERQLLETRLFRVLKLYEPTTYRSALQTVERVVHDEGSLSEIRQDVFGRVVEVLVRRLRDGSDAALVDFGRHVATALGVLERNDVSLCYAYLFPEPGDTQALLALPQSLRDRESDVIASVIESAATGPAAHPSDAEMGAAFEQLGARMARRLGAERATGGLRDDRRPAAAPGRRVRGDARAVRRDPDDADPGRGAAVQDARVRRVDPTRLPTAAAPAHAASARRRSA
jgi:hypothetical protein